MSETLRSELVGTAGLSAAALAALLLTLGRTPIARDRIGYRKTTFVFAALVLAQALHAAEEYASAFYVAFPSSLGLAPWPAGFFLAFNLSWLASWIVSTIGLRAGHAVAFFPAWFLAIVAIGNGVAHPLLALRAGGYFPGLVTSPLLAVGGILLWRRLMTITDPRPSGYGRDLLLFVETVLFTVLVPGTVTIWLPRWLGIWGDTSGPPWTIWHDAALVPLTLGLAVYARCVWEFASRGRGIPAPLDHPKHLVVTGLYRYVRNPMYVGVLLVLLGEALFFQSVSFLEYTLIWFAFVNVAVLVYEEPNLRRKFGDSYERYRSSVRRWIPGRAHR
jgi:protein-S-isoprenylcysteine O-methyltransferase Ste14